MNNESAPQSQRKGASGYGVYLNQHQQDEFSLKVKPENSENTVSSGGLQAPQLMKLNTYQENLKLGGQNSSSSGIPPRDSNPNSVYKIKKEEELKELERQEQELIEKNKQLENEKSYYKLADYFVTVGIDNYHTENEVYKKTEEAKNAIEDTPNPPKINLNIIDGEDEFDRVIQKLEIFVIKDNKIFDKSHNLNGMSIEYKHPDLINNPDEKWIDLRGDKFIYLKISYDDVNKCKRPITDLNFYKISRFKQQQNKMSIHVKQNIEPIPVKEFGDPDADTKFKKTKALGKEGKDGKLDDTYNFYGDYDLTNYFEENIDPVAQKKNLCLCYSIKKQAPIQDVILVIGQQIDLKSGQIQVQPVTDPELQQNYTINWDVPDGYKKLAYSVGTYGFLNRLLCFKNRDIMKRRLKAKVLDRYPPEGQDRHYYPFPLSISDFCFPSGIMLKMEEGAPEFFNFSLTDYDGTQIFGTCLIFDEEPSDAFKYKLKTMYVKNISQVRTIKAICILSHYSFNTSFKQILMQLFRMQISQTRQMVPMERFIINIVDEIPLPDEGTLLVQHEIGGQTASFYRPTDQNPPVVDKEEIENLFKCLDVENIIEIYSSLLLERKVLMISKHKALLTQVINCFLSFMFPFQWKHPLIPILPLSMVETLDAPFPYLIGIEPTPLLEELDIDDVIKVDLDKGLIFTPQDYLTSSHMPKLPFSLAKTLKQRLIKASEHIEQIPDPIMLQQVDLAFNVVVYDPEEETLFDHLEIRDAFLEFTSSIMSGYTKYLKDPSEQPEQIQCSRDCFKIDEFRMQKDAKKNFTFIYKLTETTHFSYFIECRALGRTDRDAQILHFEKLMNQKRTRMKPRLIFPFHEEKSIKSMPPNEEGLNQNESFSYKIFPLINSKYFSIPRQIPDYNQDYLNQQSMGSLIRNEELTKMHDNEWARYQMEVLYLLWFQIFCSTLPMYMSHSSSLIDFARKLLNYVKSKAKPMRDIEYIYRRLFNCCGSCKLITELRELNKEMIKNNVQPDKVTSGTYYQALLQCKRRAGTVEAEEDKRKSYFSHRMEDYQLKLNKQSAQESEGSQNRMSNLSGQKSLMKGNSNHENILMDEDHLGVIDFGDVLERRELTQQTAMETQGLNRNSSLTQKLSYVLENSLFLEIEKSCSKCKEFLREEEIISGFQKNLSNYTIKCPICKEFFVPKFTIYSEQDSTYIKGRKGQVISLLPPITLYKEFFNIITKKGDEILMSENFITEHKIVFWNIILYFKVLKLPIFMLDLDYSPYHQKVHCSQIKKFLPQDKSKMFNMPSRKSSNSRQLPPKLDSSALKKLNEIDQSPNRMLSFSKPYEDAQSKNGAGGRPSSIKRMTSKVSNYFASQKKQSAGSVFDEPPGGGFDVSNMPQIGNIKQQAFPDNKPVKGINFGGALSQAVENEKKGGMAGFFNQLKKPQSVGKAGSQKSGGGSVITSISDLEKIEKIMNEAVHADKNIVKYFGKHLEEFRREMHYNKEIIFSDMLTQYGEDNIKLRLN